MKNLKDMRYDAFISYRHLEPDSFVAQTLHKRLEAFSLPRSARDKAGSDKTKIERIFRDEEELSLPEDLSEPINNALANSDFLICICTVFRSSGEILILMLGETKARVYDTASKELRFEIESRSNEEDENSFIMVDDHFMYYRVPYVSFEELIERVRDY